MPTAAYVEQQIRDLGLELIRLDYVDWGGLLRGRTVSRDQFPAAIRHGINSAQTNITMSPDDHEVVPALGAQSGDFWFQPDLSTFLPLPYQPGFGHVFADVVNADGSPWFGDPRQVLRGQAQAAAEELGVVRLGFEQEGHLVAKQGATYVKAFDTRFFLADFQDEMPDFFLDMTRALRALGSPLEKYTIEGAHGMLELNTRYDTALAAADKHVRFKMAFRTLARRHGLIGSFMPKPFADAVGAGCHVHISLAERDTGRDVFGDPNDPRGLGLSRQAYGFLGGLIAHADALCAIACPTVNSYKRLQPGVWAPVAKGYGLGNRSAMIRVVQRRPGEDGQARLELRIPDGTANSYLLGAAIIACGLDGVRLGLDPGAPSELDFGHLHEAPDGLELLPSTLGRALDALAEDQVLRSAFGPRLMDGYRAVKRHEWDAFSRAVTDWERSTYLEFY